MEVMSNPVMLKVALPGVAGKESDLATVYWDTKTKDVYLLANNLPKPNDDKQYQLWALVDGKPVDAGMIDDCNGLCKLKNIQKAQAFAITLEKKGGSAAPDLSQLHVLGKVG
jgi:anti-sigma-K factor RskA